MSNEFGKLRMEFSYYQLTEIHTYYVQNRSSQRNKYFLKKLRLNIVYILDQLFQINIIEY